MQALETYKQTMSISHAALKQLKAEVGDDPYFKI